MSQTENSVGRDREDLLKSQQSGPLATLRTFTRLSGPD